MAANSPSSLRSAPPTEGAELRDRQQPAAGKFEIYVPREADVRSVPIRDLPPGVSKRMGLLSSGERPDIDPAAVTWISPVMLREKALPLGSSHAPHGASTRAFLTAAAAKASGSSPDRQSQFLLPVACSNLAAFKVLRDFLPAGDSSRPPDPDWETCQPACAPLGRGLCFSQDAIIIHRGLIFLSIKKAEPGRGRAEPGRRRAEPGRERVEPGTGRAESGRCSTPQAPPTLSPLAATCTPGRPVDDQGGGVPSAARPEKVKALNVKCCLYLALPPTVALVNCSMTCMC